MRGDLGEETVLADELQVLELQRADAFFECAKARVVLFDQVQKIEDFGHQLPFGVAEGCAIDPKNGELLKAMQQAMMAIYQDGTYRQILTKWNLLDGEIPASQIVVTPSPSTS